MLIVGLLGLVTAPSAGARLSEKHICKVHRCTTIAASREIRVFEAFGEHREEIDHELDEIIYRVCFAVWVPTGKVTELVKNAGIFRLGPYISEAKIAGPYVAFRVSGLTADAGKYDEPSLGEKVDRIDVKTGRHTSTPTMDVRFGGREVGNLYFALTALGTVAWSYYESIYSTEATVDMLSGDSDTTTTLAHGPTVEPASLAVIPGHIYWLEAGVPGTIAAP